jgi:hypothetical protein
MKVYRLFLLYDCSLGQAKAFSTFCIYCIEMSGLASFIVVFNFTIEFSYVRITSINKKKAEDINEAFNIPLLAMS